MVVKENFLVVATNFYFQNIGTCNFYFAASLISLKQML